MAWHGEKREWGFFCVRPPLFFDVCVSVTSLALLWTGGPHDEGLGHHDGTGLDTKSQLPSARVWVLVWVWTAHWYESASDSGVSASLDWRLSRRESRGRDPRGAGPCLSRLRDDSRLVDDDDDELYLYMEVLCRSDVARNISSHTAASKSQYS